MWCQVSPIAKFASNRQQGAINMLDISLVHELFSQLITTGARRRMESPKSNCNVQLFDLDSGMGQNGVRQKWMVHTKNISGWWFQPSEKNWSIGRIIPYIMEQ
jgi:hypothetical protein